MIDTKDLENFMYYELLHTPFGRTLEREYIHEIINRLWERDELLREKSGQIKEA